MQTQEFSIGKFSSELEGQTANLRNVASAFELSPIKSDTDEFRFVKKILGCEKALRFFGHDRQNAEEAKEHLQNSLVVYMDSMSAAEISAMIRELNVSVALKKLEKRGISLDLKLLQGSCEDARLLYETAYDTLQKEANSAGETLTIEMIKSTTSKFSSEVLNVELEKVKKLWKHASMLDLQKLEKNICKKNGGYRIFCSWQNYAAISGRIQSTNPNVQGFPHSVRQKCFVPPEGKALIVADYQNSEIAIMAVLANDVQLLTDISNGVDFHVKMASKLFGKMVRCVTEEDRKMAKRLTFACLYGAGNSTLQDVFKEGTGSITPVSGQMIRSVVKETYPVITQLERRIKQEQKLRFIDGTDIPLKKISKKYSALNRLVQGTGAILLKQVFLQLDKTLPIGAEVVCLIHDEIVVETPLEMFDESLKIVSDVMTGVLQNYKIDFRLPINMEVRKGEV